MLFAGCSGSQQPIGAPGAMQGRASIATHVERGKSWMKPSAKQATLLYVSDFQTYHVYVYDYRSRELVGTLSGFDEPYDQCVDAKSDVFITSFAGAVVEEYAHGGTAPIATFSTGSGTLPIGCSVSSTGDLAVTNYSPGEVFIYKNASGSPSVYHCNTCELLEPGGYDDKGDLIVPGQSQDARPVFYAILSGSATMTTLSFDGTVYQPGSAMWDGKEMTIVDNARRAHKPGPSIIRAELVGSTLKEVGATPVNDTCDGNHNRPQLGQAFIVGAKNTPVNDTRGHVVVGINSACIGRGYGKVDYWAYPRGKSPKASIITEHEEPSGLSVSIGKSN
jgi:hypothetical protein